MFPTEFQKLEKLVNDYERMSENNSNKPKITENIQKAAKEILKKELDRDDQKGFKVITNLIDRVKFTPEQKTEMYLFFAPGISTKMIDRFTKSKTPFNDFAEQVTINCRGKEIKVSKAELVNLGKYFQDLFNQSMREARSMTISLNDITLEEFQAILDLNRDPDKLDLDDPETWLAMRTFATRFQLENDITSAIPKFPKFEKIEDAIDFIRQNEITILDLSQFNSITDEHLKFVGSLTNLEQLVINLSDITDKGLAHLSGLEKLKELDLSDCDKITDKGLSYLRSLKELRKLNVTNCNKITDKGLSYLSWLKELRELDVSECSNITDQGLSHLSGLKMLRKLNIASCNNIKDQGLSLLSGLIDLRELNVANNNNITDQGLSLLSGLKELRVLSLFNCSRVRDLSHLSGLKKLQSLTLAYCKYIRAHELSHLSGLKELSVLNLSNNNNISDQGLSLLSGLTELRELDVSECSNITDQGLSHLSGLIRLQRVNLRRCMGVTEAAKALLKERSIEIVD